MEKKFIEMLGATNYEYESINEMMTAFEVGATEILEFWDNNDTYFCVNNIIYAIYKIVADSLNLQESELSLYCNSIYSKLLYKNEIVKSKAELIKEIERVTELEQ